ncbi:histidine kinase N-terminal 7TM domain-containing protein [Haloarcula halophila]|uniref:histidine kinase N-terminal 7TM domain-containing protein n=1 Tax=Haloarcula TaxID=2237 RepID=UPI0023E429D3|nr:histidine kinase N-terminal 7TM domain-containing protein [Halomicroarcula sp. DFY41]
MVADILLGAVVAGGSVAAGVGALGLAGYLIRHRGSPGVNWFITSFLATALWCLTYGFGLLVDIYPLRAYLEAVGLVAAAWTGPLFLMFTLEYTGRSATARSWQSGVILAPPAAISGLIVTFPYHSLLWTGLGPAPVFGLSVPGYTVGPLLYLMATFVFGCTGIGALLLVETVVSYGPLYRTEATAVALSTLPPAAGVLPWLFNVGPVPQLNLGPLLFLLHIALDGYAFVGSNMFETNPTTERAAQRSAIDDLGSPTFVLDTADRVVTVNDAAVDVFGLERESVLGEPLTTAADVDLEGGADHQTVSVTTDGRDRQFSVVTSPLTDPADRNVGRTVVFQEITREREREQRLDVLNRVIRHNLRNEMTVVMGHADLIEGRSDDEAVEASAETIKASGNRLLATGEKAREFEQLRGTETGTESVDVTELVQARTTELRAEFPDATVEAVLPSSPTTVETDPRVLSLVISSLLENALAHNETDDPRVVLTVELLPPGGIEITISDNGPGIEAEELAPIQKGRETSLEHTTGIGLWIVSWGVSMLGGEIEFDTDGEGTVVTLRLE